MSRFWLPVARARMLGRGRALAPRRPLPSSEKEKAMHALDVAAATEDPIRRIPSGFMLGTKTLARGAELGFVESDFYFVGRGGVLGDVDSDVVAAGFTFVNAESLRVVWERSRDVLPRREASVEFAVCAADWAQEHIPDEFDAARLAELLDPVVAAATPELAPVFAGWRALDVPAEPKAHALHQLNVLRELRGARHMVAVLAGELAPQDALRYHSPSVIWDLFGWPGQLDASRVRQVGKRWQSAIDVTNQLLAPVFDVLSDAERGELVTLLQYLLTVTS
ncbi:hypothetical protein M8542_31650 [Amycolatopsis sp. OK19-0408]|uniref:Uncharacterized protein n=1 Tax=Amycolatopsis iheyensis TaxID=2945988 RepID=A0A9X2NM76_9PSEU|nr:hypothetical protein [Amycolatopsis iheyensis]MCR6487395.1 hypothetical protein [Amycolatopsis iheyensis]